MRVVFGLGNPGYEYENTRHNIGFAVIDAIAEKTGITLTGGTGDYLIGSKKLETEIMAIVKPLTYMNNSGTVVKDIIQKYGLELSQFLVIVDDFNLPLGKLRFRQKGSSAGHNGLYSIIYHLQSEDFARLRCGIASDSMPKNKNNMADFVLSPFEKGENDIVRRLIQYARDSAMIAVMKSLQISVDYINKININNPILEFNP